jgi:hypothetical protein
MTEEDAAEVAGIPRKRKHQVVAVGFLLRDAERNLGERGNQEYRCGDEADCKAPAVPRGGNAAAIHWLNPVAILWGIFSLSLPEDSEHPLPARHEGSNSIVQFRTEKQLHISDPENDEI